MSKIDYMIKELCPNGVEKVRLGEVCNKTTNIKWSDQSSDVNYNYIDLSSVDIETHKIVDFSIVNKDNHPSRAQQIVKYQDILFGTTRPTLSRYCLVTEDFNNHVCSTGFCIIRANNKRALHKWLLYNIASKEFQVYTEENQEGAGYPSISNKKIFNFGIPLPPLSIQQEIVNILDKFTSLIDKIDEEIELRQKQYEYYREKLLTFEDGDVEKKKISEIGTLVRGNGLQKKDFTETGTGCIHYGQIYTKLGFSISEPLAYVSDELASKLTKVETGDLVIACTSENVEDVCKSVVWLGNETIVTGGHACVFKHKEDPKYIGYCFLTNEFQSQKKQYAYGAKVIDIKTEKLGEIKIPVPSLDRQQEIVSTLDMFESLISKLKEERTLRQKQYEYYREKLLTFS